MSAAKSRLAAHPSASDGSRHSRPTHTKQVGCPTRREANVWDQCGCQHDPTQSARRSTVLLPPPPEARAGSNDWVISGAHTASGKPLLSNDMHLENQIPNVWYEAQLEAPGFNVAGVTLPGIPFVVVGHNQRIAWGFTNVGPAVTDLYVENLQRRRRIPGA